LPTISNDAVVEPQTSKDVLDRNKSLVGSGDVLYATVLSIFKNGKYEIAFNNQPGNPGNATFRFGFAATCGRKKLRKSLLKPIPSIRLNTAK
jgi:exosome complex RNA-binding protein Rrp4